MLVAESSSIRVDCYRAGATKATAARRRYCVFVFVVVVVTIQVDARVMMIIIHEFDHPLWMLGQVTWPNGGT
jgi:hypothetical protein